MVDKHAAQNPRKVLRCKDEQKWRTRRSCLILITALEGWILAHFVKQPDPNPCSLSVPFELWDLQRPLMRLSYICPPPCRHTSVEGWVWSLTEGLPSAAAQSIADCFASVAAPSAKSEGKAKAKGKSKGKGAVRGR